MGNYKTILIPTDFSGYADYAVAYAQMLAKSTDAAVHFAHVVDQRYMDLISGMEGVYVTIGDAETSIEGLQARRGTNAQASPARRRDRRFSRSCTRRRSGLSRCSRTS